jgi:hypothetical protein
MSILKVGPWIRGLQIHPTVTLSPATAEVIKSPWSISFSAAFRWNG